MTTLILIGFLGGLITGISPCILPVLPVIFMSGATAAMSRDDGRSLRPYLIIAGLVVSFSVFTLIGSTLLSLLQLPQDAIRWAGLAALTLIGLGLTFRGFSICSNCRSRACRCAKSAVGEAVSASAWRLVFCTYPAPGRFWPPSSSLARRARSAPGP